VDAAFDKQWDQILEHLGGDQRIARRGVAADHRCVFQRSWTAVSV
jgi:hypothetical protein